MSTVSVSASGVVQAKKPGKATIRVLSVFDSFNYDEVILLRLCTFFETVNITSLYLFSLYILFL